MLHVVAEWCKRSCTEPSLSFPGSGRTPAATTCRRLHLRSKPCRREANPPSAHDPSDGCQVLTEVAAFLDSGKACRRTCSDIAIRVLPTGPQGSTDLADTVTRYPEPLGSFFRRIAYGLEFGKSAVSPPEVRRPGRKVNPENGLILYRASRLASQAFGSALVARSTCVQPSRSVGGVGDDLHPTCRCHS